jgi:hypothetical protein
VDCEAGPLKRLRSFSLWRNCFLCGTRRSFIAVFTRTFSSPANVFYPDVTVLFSSICCDCWTCRQMCVRRNVYGLNFRCWVEWYLVLKDWLNAALANKMVVDWCTFSGTLYRPMCWVDVNPWIKT